MSKRQGQRRDPRVPQARRLRRDVTAAERKLWWHLKRLTPVSSHFRRQAPIGSFFVDLVCHERRIVIELDGGHHNEPAQMEADCLRTAFLKASGYRVLRFWNNDVMNNIDGVLATIAENISDTVIVAPPTPDPSPPLRGGRGTISGQPFPSGDE